MASGHSPRIFDSPNLSPIERDRSPHRSHVVSVDGMFGYPTSQGDYYREISAQFFAPSKRRRLYRDGYSPYDCPEDYYPFNFLTQCTLSTEIATELELGYPAYAEQADYKCLCLGVLESSSLPTEYFCMHIPWGGHDRTLTLWRRMLFEYHEYIRYSFMIGTFIRDSLEWFIYFWCPPGEVHCDCELLWTTDEFQWCFDLLSDQGEHSDVEFEAVTELTWWWFYFRGEAAVRRMP